MKSLGAVGATALGAGAWAEFGRGLMGMSTDVPAYPFAPWVIGAGSAVFAAAVWMGTSAEPAVRVGSAGLGIEKGELRRMPWFSIDGVTWEDDKDSVAVKGKDETGRDMNVTLRANAHPQATAWLIKEARERIPRLVDVPDEPRGIPKAGPTDGETIVLDPVQVVGKRCMTSNESILYEPDARVCQKCERIYHKHHVPEECACGASLEGMRVEAESA